MQNSPVFIHFCFSSLFNLCSMAAAVASSCNYRIMTPWIVTCSTWSYGVVYERYATLNVILHVISWFLSFTHVKLMSPAFYEHHTLVMWDMVAIWLGSGDRMTFWFIKKKSQFKLCYVIFVTKLTCLKYCRTKFTFSIISLCRGRSSFQPSTLHQVVTLSFFTLRCLVFWIHF